MKISPRCAARCGPTTDSAAPYCGAMSRWFTPLSRASCSHSPASSTLAAQQAAPPSTATLLSWPVRPRRRRSIGPLALELQDAEDGADVVSQHGEAAGLDVGRSHEHAGTELLRLRHRGVGVGHREID